MNKEGNEVQQEPTEKKSIKARRKKILFWSLLATGIGAIIIVVVLLLVFLLPKEEKFEIDLDSNVSLEEGTLNGSGSYSKGDSVTIVAEDIEGYRFTGWSFNDNIISTEKEYTIVIGEDTEGEYTANYAKEYSIGIQSGNVTVAVDGGKSNAIAGEEVSFTVDAQGYRIRTVYLSCANDERIVLEAIEGKYTFTMPESDVEIVVESSKIYSVTLGEQSEYGEFNIEPMQATSGETITVNFELKAEYIGVYSLNRLYYVIAGQSDQVTIENNTFTMPEGNVTIHAELNNLYNVNLTTNIEEDVVLTGEGTYVENDTVTITAPNIAGYRFRNWTYNNATVTTQQEYTITGIDSATSGTYIANYDRLYSISVNSVNGIVAIVDNKTNAIENENIEFTVQPNADYRLIEVKVNDETVVAQEGTYSFNMPSQNVTISVTYDREYAITVDSNSSGYVQIDKQNAIAGESVEFTVSERTGYRITEVKYNDTTLQSDSNTYSFNMPDEDVTIAVTYSKLFDIVVSSNHGTVTIGDDKTEAIENESVSFTIEPSENYRIESISINSGSVEYTQEGGTYSFTMPAGLVIIAVTYDREYAITVDSNSSAYVQIEKQNAIAGELVEFTVSDRAGYRITEVKYNETTLQSESNTYSFDMPAEDVTISVTYAIEYAVAIDSSVSDMVTSVNLDKAISGEQVVVTANIQDTVTEDYVIMSDGLYYIENGSEEKVTINQIDGQYSFTMPANDITIGVEKYRRLDDFTFSGNSIKDYTGSASQLTLPAYYDTVTVNSQDYTIEKDTGTQITSIGSSAFKYCTSLTSITIPEGVTNIGISAFEDCTSLTSITIPEGVTSIRDDTFYNCTSLTSITLPNSLTSIGEYAFRGCTSLTSITLPNSLTSIGEYAFSGCYALAIVYNNSNLKIVAGAITYGDVAQYAKEVVENGGVAQGRFEVSNNVNYYINGVTNEKVAIYVVDKGVTTVTLAEDTTEINQYAFQSCTSLTSITIPEEVTSIGESAFRFCSRLTSITLPNSLTSIGDDAFHNCTSLTSITLPNSLTSIGSNAFIYCSNLTSITLPNSLTSIGTYAFYNCSSLTSITIPEGVTSIGTYTFYNCSNLTSITIPKGVTSIGSSAFSGCYALAIVYNNSNLEIVAGATTYGGVAQYAKEVVKNGGVAQGRIETTGNVKYYINSTTGDYIALAPSIGRGAITSITLIEGTTEINQYAFYNCSNLTSITIPKGVTSIGDYAFRNCTSLATVTFAQGSQLESMGGYAFYDCSALQSIEIPTSVTSIGQYAFYSCTSLTSITLPNSLTSIGGRAFSGCSNLTSITIPEGVTSIGDFAFYGCYALAIVYNNSNLEIVAGEATHGFVAQYAKEVVKNGGVAQGRIETTGNVKYYINSTTGDYIALAPSIGRGEITSITLIEGTTEINQYAFSNCTNLISITIPEGVTNIGISAFEDCTSLTSITIPEGVTSIRDDTFYNCTSLTSITIESDDIYEDATNAFSAGYLLQKATTVRVLTTIVNTYDNGYLENEANFSTRPDGEYTVFTKV